MTYIQKSGNKYHAKSNQLDGVTYDSKLEAAYAAELQLRQHAGEITKVERQVKLDLQVNGVHITNYYIDFIVHYPDGSREFTELKGLELGEWKLKWRLLEATFDSFKEHPDDRLLVVKQSSWGNYKKPKNGMIGNARIIHW